MIRWYLQCITYIRLRNGRNRYNSISSRLAQMPTNFEKPISFRSKQSVLVRGQRCTTLQPIASERTTERTYERMKQRANEPAKCILPYWARWNGEWHMKYLIVRTRCACAPKRTSRDKYLYGDAGLWSFTQSDVRAGASSVSMWNATDGDGDTSHHSLKQWNRWNATKVTAIPFRLDAEDQKTRSEQTEASQIHSKPTNLC